MNPQLNPWPAVLLLVVLACGLTACESEETVAPTLESTNVSAASPEPVAKPPLGKINGASLSKKGAAAVPPPPLLAPAEPATTVDGSGASAYTPDNNGYGLLPYNSRPFGAPLRGWGQAPFGLEGYGF